MSAKARLRALYDTFDSFHRALEAEADPSARKLCANWAALRDQYTEGSSLGSPSQLADGLEQGLREVPSFFASMEAPARAAAAAALASAIGEHYPRFLAEQGERLAKILTRGRISSERDFHLLRQAIDAAEGDADQVLLLVKLCALAERFESS